MGDLKEAAQALVRKLDEIQKDPRFVGVWQMYAIHGFKYDGPTWTEELERLRQALPVDSN